METKYTNINVTNKSRKILTLSEQETKQIKKLIKEEPKIVKLLKLLIILIPLVIIAYLVTANFFLSHEFNYFYDIGTKESFLSPSDRVSLPSSDLESDLELNYRNLTSSLVYFNVPIEEGSENISISIKFKDNFPINSKLMLGAKDSEDWHYSYLTIYNPAIEQLSKRYTYKIQDQLMLIKINPNRPDYSINEIIKFPDNLKIATDQSLPNKEFIIKNYRPQELTIDTAIRGTHTFYVYIKDNFELNIEKRDLNWYKGEDKLLINLYSLNNTLIANQTIDDDGETDAEPNKTSTKIQSGTLSINNIKEGVYRLELKNNEDIIITKISINQNKLIVKDKVFLASTNIYFNDLNKTSQLYFKSEKPITLKFITNHDGAVNQTIKIDDEKIRILKAKEDYFQEIKTSNIINLHKISVDKNDLIISGQEFYSFTENSWFEPFNSKLMPMKNDADYLEKNADYVLVNYSPVRNLENQWKIAYTSFNTKGLNIKDKKLSMLINVPHLANNTTKSQEIPVDWINITVFKPSKF